MIRQSLLVVSLVATGGVVASDEATPTVESCERERAASADDLDAYRCFDRLTRVSGGREQARSHLEALVAAQPGNTHARTMLSRTLDLGDSRAVELLGQSIDEYAREDDRYGLAWARIYRSKVHMVSSRFEEAEVDAHDAAILAEVLDDYPLIAMCRFQQTRIALLRGDNALSFGLLRTLVLDPRFDTLSAPFQASALQQLGSVCGELGLRETGLDYLRRAEAVALETGSPAWLFDARFSMSTIAMATCRVEDGTCGDSLAYARQALEVAQTDWTRQLTELRIAELTPGESGLRQLERLAGGPSRGPFGDFEVQTALGLRLLVGSPEQVQQSIVLFERALILARSGGMGRNVTRGLINVALARLAIGPPDEALETAERAMDAVERLHDLQTGETMGAMNFSRYSQIYYASIGELLADTGRPRLFDELDRAFRISERMRSRQLVEHLDRATGDDDREGEATTRRREILREISDHQQQVILGRGDSTERQRLDTAIQQLEEEEALLRAAADRSSRTNLPADATTLLRVQRELRGDEALLSFLLSSVRGVGSWLLVVTSTDVRVHPLPPRHEVETAIRFWLGLLQRGDGSERAVAARLHGDLLAAALADLPPGIGRLVILPDGPLHRIPFDALREVPEGPPLLERFEVTHAPSAGVWLRLRRSSSSKETYKALILADPDFPQASLKHSSLRSFRLADVSIGRLPHASDEARQARRSLGSGDVHVGAAASETLLKRADLQAYRVVHLAAHALIDEDRPERSAILLAPGGPAEDGLLQAREVLDLDLDGTVVTLSACRSAGGRVVVGEGVMGLARSFFQARAAVVVGGLWPLRDEDTAELMRSFYRGLGEGLPVGEAMTRAKREMRRRGLPEAAWAGVVVLGDGSRTPWRRERESDSRGGLVVSIVVLAVLIALFLRRRSS